MNPAGSRPRLAVTGTTGRLGRALATRLGGEFEVIELARPGFDLAEAGVVERIAALDFDVLLNPAAMTSLEACEDQPELAERVNARAPVALARACARSGRKMIHFSTDYVLDGRSPGLHGEDAAVDPLSVYATSKWHGEQGALDHGACVVRTSWVFGPERPAFPDQFVARALAGEPLAAVADKFSLPAFTTDLAGWTAAMVRAGCPNEVIHACQSGEPVSWHGMAIHLAGGLVRSGHLAGMPEIGELELGCMEAFRAARPRHTAMATGRLAGHLGHAPRPWREALDEHLADLLISR